MGAGGRAEFSGSQEKQQEGLGDRHRRRTGSRGPGA